MFACILDGKTTRGHVNMANWPQHHMCTSPHVVKSVVSMFYTTAKSFPCPSAFRQQAAARGQGAATAAGSLLPVGHGRR